LANTDAVEERSVESVDHDFYPIGLFGTDSRFASANPSSSAYRGVIYFAVFIVAFLWRSGGPDEPGVDPRLSPSQDYSARAFTTAIFAVGVAYLVLIIKGTRNL
jgi:hypothetical protein